MTLAACLLAGCAADRRTADAAAFDPIAFFDGRAMSRGTVTTALVSTEAFTARFEGRVADGALVLDERFRFASGERLQRWRLRRTGAGGYGGTVETENRSGALHAPVPVAGRRDGEAVELRYDGYAPGGDARLGFRHRMTPQADGTVLNEVRVSKFGLPIAGARVVFEKVPRPGN